MTIVSFTSLFIFLIIAIVLCSLVGLGINYIHNKKVMADISGFALKINNSAHVIYENVQLTNLAASGLNFYPSINNSADLYLFENFLTIMRTQNFLVKHRFSPFVICKNPSMLNGQFDHFQIYKPDNVTFNAIRKGEVVITLSHPTHKHYKTTITLKGLTDTQLEKLNRIKQWSE